MLRRTLLVHTRRSIRSIIARSSTDFWTGFAQGLAVVWGDVVVLIEYYFWKLASPGWEMIALLGGSASKGARFLAGKAALRNAPTVAHFLFFCLVQQYTKTRTICIVWFCIVCPTKERKLSRFCFRFTVRSDMPDPPRLYDQATGASTLKPNTMVFLRFVWCLPGERTSIDGLDMFFSC